MEKQLLRRVNPENAAKELTRVTETVTCLECCKFYILPETAICGHTLCHGCWIGRQTCPVCALPLKRRTLKSNAVIKRYTECVRKTTALFEKQYNIKMEEFAPDPPLQAINNIVQKDPSKTVNAWLCDSQNHFSAPLSTEASMQAESPAVEVKTCEIQVHTGSKKVASPTKVIHAPPPAQDDWDKIESIPDTEEFVKNKENVGPNLEPFILDDDEYTTDHPRRSSRKREHKNDSKPSETSADKHSNSNMSMDTDKLSKIKQNWSNVKKMRKEFSKLHKKNKNKLNVSIEMCKKTKSAISKPATTPPVEAESQKIIVIDDCTPNTKINEREKSPVFDEINVDTNNKHDMEDNRSKHDMEDNRSKHDMEDNHIKSPKNALATDIQSLQAVRTNQNDENVSIIDHKTTSSSILNHLKSINNHENERHSHEMSTTNNNIPFLKKSALQTVKPNDMKSNSEHVTTGKENTVQSVNHVVNDNMETDSDDIQITIKIGSTLTNIYIKKKKNDVKVKLNTDQGAQTMQCMDKSISCNASLSAPKDCDVQNIEINIGSEGVVSAVTQQTKCIEASIENSKLNVNKTESTKKNTASAETIPVEISASLERELSRIMECNDDKNDEIQKEKTQDITQEKHEEVNKIPSTYTVSNKEQKSEDIELDEDMFASGSVQENVQLLKATKVAPSEILMPTLKTRKQTQTQRQADKRNRENEEETTSNKKAKVSEIYEDSIDEVANEGNKDESSINYDSVMGQVFASIDADMENVDKSQSIIKMNDQTLVDKQDNITQQSQFLKTQKTQRKVLGLSKLGNATQNTKSNLPPKDSESLFALSNVDSQVITQKGHNPKHGPETQAHIENLLTPRMCQDLAASEHGQELRSQAENLGQELRSQARDQSHEAHSQTGDQGREGRAASQEEGIPATPQDRDDSDMSVCEETPQKASPFTRKSATSNAAQSKRTHTQSQLNPAESQLIKEIIDISDSEKDATVIAHTRPKQTLETPNIQQFCNSVQHNSTPVARKSLNFCDRSIINTEEFTKPRAPIVPKYCIAASCLTSAEVKTVEILCAKNHWKFVKEFTKELTHLVVKVDEEGRSQRTVKFMCALAAGRWIVRYEWVEAVLRRGHAPEAPFEALDWTGEPGPKLARTATHKLFEGFTFFCMPPFSVLSEPVLKMMLEMAGGRVVSAARDVRVDSAAGAGVRLLLAEPEHTQENQFTCKLMLEMAGGRVVSAARDVRVDSAAGAGVRLLLAEPEHTQENQFTCKLMLEMAGGRVVSAARDVRVDSAAGAGVRLLLAEPEHTQENQFTCKLMLEMAGGRVVSAARDVRVDSAAGAGVRLLLAEPEHTQENQFTCKLMLEMAGGRVVSAARDVRVDSAAGAGVRLLLAEPEHTQENQFTCKLMLEMAGGRVVSAARDVRVDSAAGAGVRLLLAEPEHTQENQFTCKLMLEMAGGRVVSAARDVRVDSAAGAGVRLLLAEPEHTQENQFTCKLMLEMAGGRVVSAARDVRVDSAAGAGVRLLLAEPEHTQENQFTCKLMLEMAGGRVVSAARDVRVDSAAGAGVRLLLAEPEHTQENQFTCKLMLEMAGGRVVSAARDVRVDSAAGAGVRLLLAEPEHTQENQFTCKLMLEMAGGRVVSAARDVRVDSAAGAGVRLLLAEPEHTQENQFTCKLMLEMAGGRVVSAARDVRVDSAAGAGVRLLLAEPEHTQENQFTYLAIELSIVPVNYEWALNCLGSYSLAPVLELLLCPAALLPPAAARWPPVLVTQELDPVSESD